MTTSPSELYTNEGGSPLFRYKIRPIAITHVYATVYIGNGRSWVNMNVWKDYNAPSAIDSTVYARFLSWIIRLSSDDGSTYTPKYTAYDSTDSPDGYLIGIYS